MPDNNTIEFPVYFETDLSSVKLKSKYEAVVIYLDPLQPKVNHQKRWNEYVIEYRMFLAQDLTTEITEDEFKTRYKRALKLLEDIEDVSEFEPPLTEVSLISTTAKKIAIESQDRQQFYGNAIIKKGGVNYNGVIDVIINRYGEIKFGSFIFDDRQPEFWNEKRIGINGFIQLSMDWKQFIELNLSEPLPAALENPLSLYVYEIGTSPIVGPEFNDDFNNDFKIN